MTAAPRPADRSEQASLRQSEVPDEGTPERAAWDLVVAWVWEDHEYLSPPPLGRVIHDYYPKLIARIAAREADRDATRRALAAAEATTQRLWSYIAVLRTTLNGANKEIRRQRLRADALEPGWAVKWDKRLSREKALEVDVARLRAALTEIRACAWIPSCGACIRNQQTVDAALTNAGGEGDGG